MIVTKISNGPECGSGINCPAVHITDQTEEDYLIQGYEVTDPELLAQLNLPAGESIVRIPRTLLDEVRR